MALGLVSFGLAVAINALAKMVWNIDYVGWILAIAILVGGPAQLLFNLMGAFAHGIRLHYVSFSGNSMTAAEKTSLPSASSAG